MKLCDVPGVVPVALRFNELLPVPYITTPVALMSVLNVMTALVVPDNSTFTFEGSDTRFTSMEAAPVFPAVSVAITVIVLDHPVRPETTFDHVHVPSVAAEPFTVTLATHPVSVTVPEIVGEPVTVAPLACEVIATNGATVSLVLTLNESTLELLFGFQARSDDIPVHTETSIVPVDTFGVIVTVYPVALV